MNNPVNYIKNIPEVMDSSEVIWNEDNKVCAILARLGLLNYAHAFKYDAKLRPYELTMLYFESQEGLVLKTLHDLKEHINDDNTIYGLNGTGTHYTKTGKARAHTNFRVREVLGFQLSNDQNSLAVVWEAKFKIAPV